MANIIEIILYASIGGIIPCLFWLIFWLRETHDHPEPPKIIIACFIGGMLSTLLAIPFQFLVSHFSSEGIVPLTLWAFIEEIAKFFVCWFIVLRKHRNPSPVDIVIYMLTVALGFAALENTLYLISPLSGGDFATSIMTGNLRFIGATLLHTLCSAIIGIFIAFAYYKTPNQKEEYALIGLFFAGVLHTLFNFFILMESGVLTFLVFSCVWILIIMLIVVIEKVKNITDPNLGQTQNI